MIVDVAHVQLFYKDLISLTNIVSQQGLGITIQKTGQHVIIRTCSGYGEQCVGETDIVLRSITLHRQHINNP